MWGTQCNFISGFWQYANQNADGTGSGWVTSAVPCNDGRHSGTINMPQNSWIHIQKGVHMTTTGCAPNSKTVPSPSGSGPCLYFDYLAINGTVYPNWGKVVSSQTGAGFTLAGDQFQQNMHCGSSCSINEYIDKASITAGEVSSTSSFAYTIGSGTVLGNNVESTNGSINPCLLYTSRCV